MSKPESPNSSAATLLPELLEQIFEEVDADRRSYMLAHPIQKDFLLVNNPCYDQDGQSILRNGEGVLCRPPGSTISSLIRVCKGWKPIAERSLYWSIDIRANTYTLYPQGYPGTRSFSLLLKTLKGNVVLANLIRELRAVVTLRGGLSISTQIEILAQIISACTQLSHLTVISPVIEEIVPRQTLFKCLPHLNSLRSIVFVQRTGHRYNEVDQLGLCSTEQLLRRMDSWPNIEHVVVATDARLPVESFTSEPQVWSPCDYEFPHLRTFSVLQPTTSPRSLQALRAAAPQLQTLRVGLEASVDPHYLRDAFTTWMPTLHTLHLEHTEQFSIDDNFEDLLNHLPNLRALYISTRLVTPRMLCGPATLETLTYYIEDDDYTHIDALIDVLCHFSNLRTLTIAPLLSASNLLLEPASQIPKGNIQRLDRACRERGITFYSCLRDLPDMWSDSDDDEDWRYDLRDDDSGILDPEDWLDEYFDGAPCRD